MYRPLTSITCHNNLLFFRKPYIATEVVNNGWAPLIMFLCMANLRHTSEDILTVEQENLLANTLSFPKRKDISFYFTLFIGEGVRV